MSSLTDIFARFGPAYLHKFSDTMPQHQYHALIDILACHTESLGGSVHCCRQCGYEHYVFHSCRNRSCPKCQKKQTDEWTARLKEKALPVRHFHLIFTLPAELRRLEGLGWIRDDEEARIQRIETELRGGDLPPSDRSS